MTSPESPRRGWAIASLALGLLGIPTLGLLGIGALLSIIFGVVALVKSSQQPETYGGKGLAISGIVASAFSVLVSPFLLGIIAAIAIPTLLRSRVAANETATLDNLRTFILAQTAYQTENAGFFDTPECLSAPARCIPNFPATDHHTFLTPEMIAPKRNGYLITFHPRQSAGKRPAGEAPSSPSSLASFAYVAVPQSWGQTGTRAFCADSKGQFCFTTDEGEPVLEDGWCSSSCRSLR